MISITILSLIPLFLKNCRVWFEHGGLSLTCGELRRVFAREGRFTVLVVDGLFIVFRTLDRMMYTARGLTDNMWRHWMPASFAVRKISFKEQKNGFRC